MGRYRVAVHVASCWLGGGVCVCVRWLAPGLSLKGRSSKMEASPTIMRMSALQVREEASESGRGAAQDERVVFGRLSHMGWGRGEPRARDNSCCMRPLRTIDTSASWMAARWRRRQLLRFTVKRDEGCDVGVGRDAPARLWHNLTEVAIMRRYCG